jgi:hypothetical protein
VHERGPLIALPPTPPDVHALQSYFWDLDSKQWIRTVLAPMGRELAAKWQGAHKIPNDQIGIAVKAAKAKAKAETHHKRSSPMRMVVFAVAFLVLVGGVGMVASQSGMLASAKASDAPGATNAASGAPAATGPAAVSGAPGATAQATTAQAATAAPTEAPAATAAQTEAPVRTAAPPVVTVPAGPRVTLGEGTVVVYTGGVTSVSRGGFLPARFSVIAPTGRPAAGELTIVLGDLAKDPRLVSGLLDANGRIALDIPATLALGQYPLSIVYKGSRAQLATITIR